MSTLRTFALLALLAAPAAGTPQTPADIAPPQAGAETFDDALRMLRADDLEGAIGVLETLMERGDASPKAISALGALYLEIGLTRDALTVLRPLAEGDDADAAVLFNCGRAALELDEVEAGEAYLQRSARIQPVSPAGRLLGLRLGARGQTPAAYQLLRPWALANPDDREARLAAAVAALKLERLTEAEELLDGLGNDNPRLTLLRADLALQQRDPATALELLEPLAQNHPPEMSIDVLVLTAGAQLELGRSADAVALLEAQGAEHPRLALSLARAKYQGGDLEGALATLGPLAAPLFAAEEPLEPPPAQRGLAASMVLEMGRLLVAAGEAGKAVIALERAAQLDPWSRETWQELARAYAAGGETEKAQQATAKLQQLAEAKERAAVPGMSGRRRLEDTTGKRLAEALEWVERGESDRALTMVRQEIGLTPDDLRPRLLEVRILLGMGRHDDALQSIEIALGRFPDHPDALHFRAVVQMARGDLEAAAGDLERALERVPEHLPAMNDLALVHANRGDLEAARGLLEQILAKHPNDPLARRRLEALTAREAGAGGGG